MLSCLELSLPTSTAFKLKDFTTTDNDKPEAYDQTLLVRPHVHSSLETRCNGPSGDQCVSVNSDFPD
jgi:hypothetical protein